MSKNISIYSYGENSPYNNIENNMDIVKYYISISDIKKLIKFTLNGEFKYLKYIYHFDGKFVVTNGQSIMYIDDNSINQNAKNNTFVIDGMFFLNQATKLFKNENPTLFYDKKNGYVVFFGEKNIIVHKKDFIVTPIRELIKRIENYEFKHDILFSIDTKEFKNMIKNLVEKAKNNNIYCISINNVELNINIVYDKISFSSSSQTLNIIFAKSKDYNAYDLSFKGEKEYIMCNIQSLENYAKYSKNKHITFKVYDNIINSNLICVDDRFFIMTK